MKKIEISIVFFFSFFFLSLGANWGLPNNERIDLLFDNKKDHSENISSLVNTYKKQKNLTDNKIYIDDYENFKKNLDYQTAINMGLARYLIVPYAGDDAFTLKALKNLNPSKFDFDPDYYFYGGGFVYTCAAVLFIADKLNLIELVNKVEFYLEKPNEIGKIYLLLRYLVIFFTSLGVLLLFIVSREIGGIFFSYLSSFLLLINPETIASSHAIEPHSFVLPFFLLAIFFSLKFLKQKKNLNLILFGLFSGIAIGTQITSIYLVFIFFYIQYKNFTNHLSYREILSEFIKYFLSLLIVFFIINPYFIINYHSVIENFFIGINNLDVNDQSKNFNKFWAPYQISFFLLLLFLISFIYSYLFLKDEKIRLILSLIFPSILIYFLFGQIMQYVYSSLAIFSLLSGLMVINIFKKFTKIKKLIFISVFFCLFFISTINRSFFYYTNYIYDNKLLASNWVNRNIEKEKVVGIQFPPTNWDTIPFRFKNYKIQDYRNKNSDYLILLNFDQENIEGYKKLKSFPPKILFGYKPKLKGELQAIYAKDIDIYEKK